MEIRTYEYSNYPEWKIKALQERRDFCQDVLDYDPDIDDDFRKELEDDIKKLNEWLHELGKQKKAPDKDAEILAWKIKILDEIKSDIELNMNPDNENPFNSECDEETEETEEIYKEELKYVKRWIKELKV